MHWFSVRGDFGDADTENHPACSEDCMNEGI